MCSRENTSAVYLMIQVVKAHLGFAVGRERELMFMFALCRRPSVCRLSSVTFVHPTQPIELLAMFLRHLIRW